MSSTIDCAEMMSAFELECAENLARGRAEGEARGRAEGEARGRAEGEARGRAEGEARGRAEVALSLLKEGLAIDFIMRVTGLSEQEIMKLAGNGEQPR